MMDGIRVTTNRMLDYHDLDSLAQSIVRADMSNEEKALACYDVVRQGLFQYPWVYNVKERREEWHDAVKLLNTYGHGLCGVQARTLGALYQKVFGFDNQRLIGVNERNPGDWELEKDPGAFVFSLMQKDYSAENPSGHTTVEVFYDGHWHHLDPTVAFYCYTRDGSRIACLDETIADSTLVTQPSRPISGLMPDGDLRKVFYASRFADWGRGPGYFMVMDTSMDVSLQPGQSVTWFWDRTHGRFFWPDIWAERFLQDYFKGGPRHPNADMGQWRHYGNGTFATERGLLDDGEGLALPFPYVLVGGTLRFYAEATIRRVVLTCACDGLQEREVRVTAGLNEVDLDDFVMGGYDLTIRPEGGALGNVTVDLYFQHNFITRPRLLSGENAVTVQGESDGQTLGVTWEWLAADGEVKHHAQTVAPPETYRIDVGRIVALPEENPKYMKRLEIAMRGDSR